jgi:hypothetical protein
MKINALEYEIEIRKEDHQRLLDRMTINLPDDIMDDMRKNLEERVNRVSEEGAKPSAIGGNN